MDHWRIISDVCTATLKEFPISEGMCVGIAAQISHQLALESVSNRVILGTLRCSGVTAFEYEGEINTEQNYAQWGGHAWVLV